MGGREKGKVRNAETELTGKNKSYNIRSTAQERKKAMATGKALNGKPYAGNPHVAPSQCYGGTGRFDEGEVASCTAEASLRRVHCRRQPEAMTRPQVASRSEVARGLRASVCAATPRRGSLLYMQDAFNNIVRVISSACLAACVFHTPNLQQEKERKP